jgi:hypothetical protein
VAELSAHIGLIVGVQSRQVYSVINPEYEEDLDNPNYLQLQNEQGEGVAMIKVDRGAYDACMSADDVLALVAQWYVQDAMSRPLYDGPDTVTGQV